jgi:hypothetical protein
MMPLEKITNLDYRFDLNYKSTRSTFWLNPELTLNLEDDGRSSSDDSSQIARRCQMIQDSWRQARFSSNATFGFITTSALVNIFGIVLLFSGKVTEGSVATAGGLTSNIVSVRLLKFTKETNDRLDRLAKEFKDDD